jgi:hypothetical protein
MQSPNNIYNTTTGKLTSSSNSSKLDLLEHTLQALASLLTILLKVYLEFNPDIPEGIADWELTDRVWVEEGVE